MNEAAIVKEIADSRTRHWQHKPSNRPLGQNYEETGTWGEWEFGKWSGLMPHLEPGGDGGWDFLLPVKLKVDVKASRRGDALLVEVGKVKADVYVLAKVEEKECTGTQTETGTMTTEVSLLGWCWGRDLLAVPPKNTGKGVVNHRVAAGSLRPMEELKRIMEVTAR